MSKHTCPSCGHRFMEVGAPQKSRAAKRRIQYINAFGKPVYRSKLMNAIMDARERGEFAPVPDWFDEYCLKHNIDRSLYA